MSSTQLTIDEVKKLAEIDELVHLLNELIEETRKRKAGAKS